MIRVMNLIVTVIILLAVASCTAAVSPNGDPTQVAEGAHAQIYASAIREIHTYALSSKLVYIVSTTEDLVYAGAPIAPARKLPADLQGAVTAELTGEAYQLIWIEAFNDAPIDPDNGEIAGGDGIIITLGNIHAQDDGSVLLSFFMTCADMCGYGVTYVLEKSFATWEVTGTAGPEIAS